MRPRVRRPVRLTLYTRQGCGLCRRAEQLVAREAAGAEVELVDIDGDDDLVRRYAVRVPVLEIDGTEVAAYELGPGDVRRLVRAARRRG
ncbi:MAG: glutaredoxin family protein [Nitriliruptoraceae bacterium]